MSPLDSTAIDRHVQKILALSESPEVSPVELLAALAVALYGLDVRFRLGGTSLHPDLEQFLYIGKQIIAEALQTTPRES